jgi:hypothetical protein
MFSPGIHTGSVSYGGVPADTNVLGHTDPFSRHMYLYDSNFGPENSNRLYQDLAHEGWHSYYDNQDDFPIEEGDGTGAYPFGWKCAQAAGRFLP